MDSDEYIVYMSATTDYSGYMLFAFENGKVAKVDMSCYATKVNRKKLINAYSDRSPLVGAYHIQPKIRSVSRCLRLKRKTASLRVCCLWKILYQAKRKNVTVQIRSLREDIFSAMRISRQTVCPHRSICFDRSRHLPLCLKDAKGKGPVI